jgi:adenylate cyclase
MRVEIERKFLVSNEGWKASVTHSVHCRDGLVMKSPSIKLRVRREPSRALLTFKGPKQGICRHEFEYEIPHADADLLLAHHCEDRVVEKTRFFVRHGRLEWHVDVFEGVLSGIVLAELEIDHPDEEFDLPEWLGREVTNNPAYKQANLFADALGRRIYDGQEFLIPLGAQSIQSD